MTKIFVFPGQGSQSKGMGEGLFEIFGDIVKQADAQLGYSVKNLCLEDSDSLLSQTQYTQPCLYVVNALTYLQKIKETGQKPDFVAGHSLGEYNALFAAEVFDFLTGLKLVQERGRLMSTVSNSGMAAVLRVSRDKIQNILEKHFPSLDIANLNSPGQTIISGQKTDIEKAKEIFEKEGAGYMVLNVSGAFHSRYMENSRQEFSKFLDSFSLASPKIQVISNVEALPYRDGNIKSNLTSQITHPVRWNEIVDYLLGLENPEFEEIGPGKVLSGLINQIKRDKKKILLKQ